MWLLAHYPATRVSAFSFLTPIFALMAGALWLHEPIWPDVMSTGTSHAPARPAASGPAPAPRR